MYLWMITLEPHARSQPVYWVREWWAGDSQPAQFVRTVAKAGTLLGARERVPTLDAVRRDLPPGSPDHLVECWHDPHT